MATSWILELARCLNEEGLAIITIIDEHSIPQLRKTYEEKGENSGILEKHIGENNITEDTLRRIGFLPRYTTSSPWLTGVLYSSEFFVRRAEIAFDVIEIIEGFKGYQTGYVLRRK